MFKFFFQSGEFLAEAGTDYLDLLFQVIAAFIGVGGALYIFYKQRKQEFHKKESERIAYERDKLKYLRYLFYDSLREVEMLCESITESSKEFNDSNGTIFPLIAITAGNSLDRVVNKINQEEHFHAYLNQISDDDISEILTYFDYFNLQIKQLIEMLDKIFLTQSEGRRKFEEKFDHTQEMIAHLLSEKGISIPLYNSIDALQKDFFVKHEEKILRQYPLDYYEYKIEFLDPLSNLLEQNNPVFNSHEYNIMVSSINAIKSLTPLIINNKNSFEDIKKIGVELKEKTNLLKPKLTAIDTFIRKEE